MTLKLPIYMDNHATTRVDPRVFQAMLPYFSHTFCNSASLTHPFPCRAAAPPVQSLAQEMAGKSYVDEKIELPPTIASWVPTLHLTLLFRFAGPCPARRPAPCRTRGSGLRR